jgi:hypothetical protein
VRPPALRKQLSDLGRQLFISACENIPVGSAQPDGVKKIEIGDFVDVAERSGKHWDVATVKDIVVGARGTFVLVVYEDGKEERIGASRFLMYCFMLSVRLYSTETHTNIIQHTLGHSQACADGFPFRHEATQLLPQQSR